LTGVQEIFAQDGPLARTLSGYEQRQQQVEMATAVAASLEGGGVVLAEAGTGTGKTLAYLAPAVSSGRKVIVSTGTRNLQEQIFFKDLVNLEEALGIRIDAAYLKGQENYLCRRRLEAFLSSPAVLSCALEQVSSLKDWAGRTSDGDRMEIEGMSDTSPLWRQVCSTRETRIGSRCPFHEECHVTRARARANAADIVIVNHHLYFADLATRMQGGAVLPDHDAIIFDEAHLIEDVATEFFSIKVSSARVDRLAEESLAAVRGARLTDDPHEDRREPMARSVKGDAADFFGGLATGTQGRASFPAGRLPESMLSAYHRLDSSLEALEMSLRALEGRDQAIDHCAARAADLRSDLASIAEGDRRGFVFWMESRPRSAILGASPIDISEQFRQGVLFRVPSVVLTSATLSTSGNFGFLRSRLGIDFDCEELSLETPFDYPRQARLFIPSDLPDPREEGFAQAAAEMIDLLCDLSGGGALVLCTSNKNMRAFHESLEGRTPGPLLLQGEAPKTQLMERFTADRTSVLVATASFWQGVDLPGDALRMVIIDKLPFASPVDPVVSARIEHSRDAGANPFMDYQVPQAALALKQGFGRLIRTGTDRGVVAILDSRLLTMRYRRVFLESLPQCPVTSDFSEIREWWSSRSLSGDRETA